MTNTRTDAMRKRTRLERAVINAAKTWAENDKGFTRIALFQAARNLAYFEAEQLKNKVMATFSREA